MANFHNDEWIMKRVEQHYKEALEHFPEDRIVGIFLQGSQNYGLDTENSDIDTKLIVTPTFNDLAFNLKPVSTTHIRENNEHIDFKDIRLMLQTFRKHNINFIEILFTPYYILNPKYEYFWKQLIAKREMIARSNPLASFKAMRGVALEKYHALSHPYPSKADILKIYGYDPKQLHHLVRIDRFMEAFMDDNTYEDCLIPGELDSNFLDIIKTCPEKLSLDLDKAQQLADYTLELIEKKYTLFTSGWTDEEIKASKSYKDTEELLNRVQYAIMEEAIRSELDC
jgi:predicted nucleotidyltransferase